MSDVKGVRSIIRNGAIALVFATILPKSAEAACSIGKIADLPVTMERMGPMIGARINGTPVEFMADSGAFYSIISPGSAQSLHLPTQPGPPGFYVSGINGAASANITTVKTFTFAGIDLHGVQFIVAGSETSGVGVIGQNVLGLGDVEYDLPHGFIRLMRSNGCSRANLAYWAAGRSFSIVPLEPRSPEHPHTIGTVTVNGVKIRATFDTGASASILSLSAAARAGIKPTSPGVVDGGAAFGIRRKLVRTWIAPVESLSLGEGEQIHRARVRIGAIDVDTDMLLGADFFIAHRIYVDNRDHRLFLTYEGGPIFNITAKFDGPGGATDTPPPVAAVENAETYSRTGAVAMARDDLEKAIADFSKAISAGPAEPRYRKQRAAAYLKQGKPASALADLDKAIELAPDDVDALMSRVALKLRDRDRTGAVADLDAADRAAAAAAMERLALGSLLALAGQPQRAIGQIDRWIKAHPDDVRRPMALNERCWARALANTDLDAALRDCDAAVRARPGNPEFYDSRGLAELRRGDLAKAISDYDMALARRPNMVWSLYGRGIAKLRSGNASGGKTDMDRAAAIEPHIADDAKIYGITP